MGELVRYDHFVLYDLFVDNLFGYVLFAFMSCRVMSGPCGREGFFSSIGNGLMNAFRELIYHRWC